MHATLRLALGIPASLAIFVVPVVRADITVAPGNTDPPYPPAMPDPWMVSTLDLEGNILTVDDASQVTVSDTLLVGGRIVLDTGGQIDADRTALFDDAGLTSPSAGAAFVTASTLDAGFFAPVTDAVLSLAIDDAGLFTTDAASTIGELSTVVIRISPLAGTTVRSRWGR